jgi:hypothetical protein
LDLKLLTASAGSTTTTNSLSPISEAWGASLVEDVHVHLVVLEAGQPAATRKLLALLGTLLGALLHAHLALLMA